MLLIWEGNLFGLKYCIRKNEEKLYISASFERIKFEKHRFNDLFGRLTFSNVINDLVYFFTYIFLRYMWENNPFVSLHIFGNVIKTS